MKIERGSILTIVNDRGDVNMTSGTGEQLDQLDISPIRVEEPIT